MDLMIVSKIYYDSSLYKRQKEYNVKTLNTIENNQPNKVTRTQEETKTNIPIFGPISH